MKLLKLLFLTGMFSYITYHNLYASPLSVYRIKNSDATYQNSSFTTDTSQINAVSRNAPYLVRTNPDSLIIILHASYKKSLEIGYSKGIGDSYLHLATSYFYKFYYDSAEYYYNKAFDIYYILNDIRGMARSQHGLSYVFSVKSDMSRSLQYMLNSKKYLFKLYLLPVLVFLINATQAQQAVPAAGGNASGSGGSVSYSVGQVVYTTATVANRTVTQGVLQAYINEHTSLFS